MFKFFSELKKELKLPDIQDEYQFVNLSGKLLYVEGQKGISLLSDTLIVFKTKRKTISVSGKNLKLKDVSVLTLSVVGDIEAIEVN